MTGKTNTFGSFANPSGLESEVRYYSRQLPAVFSKAANAVVWDEQGRTYIDFLSACGSLNYGHNHPVLKARVLDYLSGDGLLNGLDLQTVAKRRFLETLHRVVLASAGLDYRVQFTGPTGTNAVEAALKLARKVTGRHTVVAFTNAFHGMTAGALSIGGNAEAGALTGRQASDVVRLPFDGYAGAGTEELDRYAEMVEDPTGGVSPPAAFVLEVVQGEGGLNVARSEWLAHLAALARRLGALLIIDDIQAGCGRTGSFFSFDSAGIRPDIVCLSKSLSGIGLPMSLLLIAPDIDQWNPGEHNGTFRGNNLAFVAATAALELWQDAAFKKGVAASQALISDWLDDIVQEYGHATVERRGVGMMSGLAFARHETAAMVASECFRRRLLIETAGPRAEVIKVFPPLTIEPELLNEGLRRLKDAIATILEAQKAKDRPIAA